MVPCVQSLSIAVAIWMLQSSWVKLSLLKFYPFCCYCIIHASPDSLDICWCDFIWRSLRSTVLINVYVVRTHLLYSTDSTLTYRDVDLIRWTVILKHDGVRGKSVFKNYLMRKCPDGLGCKRGKQIYVVVVAPEHVEHWKTHCT